MTFSSFFFPAAPDFVISVNAGMTSMAKSCTMMLAVMYGPTPIAKMEKLWSAPPPNRFIMPKMALSPTAAVSCETSTKGTGMPAPKR